MIEGELLFRGIFDKFRGGRIVAGLGRLPVHGNKISDGDGMVPWIAIRIRIHADQAQIVRLHPIREADPADRGDLARARRGVGKRDVPIDEHRVLPAAHRCSPAQRATPRRLEAGDELFGQSCVQVGESQIRIVKREGVGHREAEIALHGGATDGDIGIARGVVLQIAA